jgi:hypothetical protein
MPHMPGPPPPHVAGDMHVPQESMLPQPSPAGPQLMFCCAHVLGTHAGGPASPAPHMLKPPPPQTAGAMQVPQSRVLPHPSEFIPQFQFSPTHVFGTHAGGPASPPSVDGAIVPHTLKPPPPHVSGDMHVPQLMTLPHPSVFIPQLKPSWAHVFGLQVPLPDESPLASPLPNIDWVMESAIPVVVLSVVASWPPPSVPPANRDADPEPPQAARASDMMTTAAEKRIQRPPS